VSSLGKLRARRDGADISGDVFGLLPKRGKALSNAGLHFLVHQRGLTTLRAKKVLRLEPPAE
jgi:hypothetical protein